MRVTLHYKNHGNIFVGTQIQQIGDFIVPVTSLLKRSKRPQFFNVINEEGQFVGSILCNFHLYEYSLTAKERKDKHFVPVFHQILDEEFKAVTVPEYKVNIKVALIGLRNMLRDAIKPVVRLRLTHGADTKEDAERELNLDEEWLKDQCKITQTTSPNFGEIVVFEKVKLPSEPLCWPYIEVAVTDKYREENRLFHFGYGCEDCFTTLSLIDF